MSGSGGSSGYAYQDCAIAYVAAHILAEEPLQWGLETSNPSIPIAVEPESGGPGDDLCITLENDVVVELQAKKRLQKDKLFEPLLRLVEGINGNSQLYGILLTDTSASQIVRNDLREDIVRLSQGRSDNLKEITREFLQKLKSKNLPSTDTSIFRRLRIVILDLFEGQQSARNAQLILQNIISSKQQANIVWELLCNEGKTLTRTRGKRNRDDWLRFLGRHNVSLIADSKTIQASQNSFSNINEIDSSGSNIDNWIHLHERLVNEISEQSCINSEQINMCKEWLQSTWEEKTKFKSLILVELDKCRAQTLQDLIDRNTDPFGNSDFGESAPDFDEEYLVWKSNIHDSSALYYHQTPVDLQIAVDTCLKALSRTFDLNEEENFRKNSHDYYELYSQWFSPAFVNTEVWEDFKSFSRKRYEAPIIDNYSDAFIDFIGNVLIWSIQRKTNYLRLRYNEEMRYFSHLALGSLGICKHIVEAKYDFYISRESFLAAFYDWSLYRGLQPQIRFLDKMEISNAELRLA
jgi:hypothetical protein